MICPSCNKTEINPFGNKNSYELYQCQSCSLIFVHPMPSNEVLNDFYQNYHKTSQYTGKIDSKQRRARKRIKSIIKYTKGKSFIDVGCNAGFAVEAARTLGLDAMGIDVDKTSVEFAQGFYPESNFQAISIQELAKTEKTFDMIYCSEVIEHLSQVQDFVSSLYKILKPDGVILLTTPDILHYSVNKAPIEWDAVRPPEHLLYFSKKSLISLFKAHNFSTVKCRFNFKPTLKAIIRK
jgi:2-polyprenyl-3-methyl-5-hydroxy-6-metoxy-1,4-benzoquinol methylase